ncbi:MAG: hypothetical protein QM811_24395 [Pirellulales bacterium]
MRGERGLHGDAGRDFAARPRPSDGDGLVWARIVRRPFEDRQKMLGAIGRPSGQQAMAFQLQRPAAMHGHETTIAHDSSVCVDKRDRRETSAVQKTSGEPSSAARMIEYSKPKP